MKESTLEELAYLIRSAKENNLPKPIIFLGAGASATGGIPLAGAIVKDILQKYPHNPKIKKLAPEEREYAKLMECLLPTERNRLLKQYIDRAKINVTHIYLAHLITAGYVDYVLTVNFDNLMLRALALFNYFPPTYDLAVLKSLTTTSLHEKSVVYLHGQHHGLWLLNTDEEMRSVDQMVPSILNKIASERPWIIIGYSGIDRILNHLVDLGRFDNGMFWVCYKDYLPEEKVCQELLNKANRNASIIKGYDSDTFMLSLNTALGLGQPLILDKPFSFLENAVDNIVENYEKKEYTSVKERLTITKKQIRVAVEQFEEGKVIPTKKIGKEIISDQRKKEIINKIIQKDFEGLAAYRELISQSDDLDLKNQLSDLYFGAATALSEKAKEETGERAIELWLQSIEQLEISLSLNPDSNKALCEMGFAYISLGDHQEATAQAASLKKAIDCCQQATQVDDQDVVSYCNWGIALDHLARLADQEAKLDLIQQAIFYYEKAMAIDAQYESAINNLGACYLDLIEYQKRENHLSLLKKSQALFLSANKVNPENIDYLLNLCTALQKGMRHDKEDIDVQLQRILQYLDQAEKLTTEPAIVIPYRANSYLEAAFLTSGAKQKAYFEKAIAIVQEAPEWKEEQEMRYHILGSSFLGLAQQETGELALELVQKALANFALELELNDQNPNLHDDYSVAYREQAKYQTGVDQVNSFFECEKHILRVKELSGRVYNLACFYAIRGLKEKALIELATALQHDEVTAEYVLEDVDWSAFRTDPAFLAIVEKHQN